MRILGHGIDLVPIVRVAQMIEQHGDRFLDRCFTAGERDYASKTRRKHEHLAARFAAKEAAMKALGTGWSMGVGWTDFEVVNSGEGVPSICVSGRAAEIARERGICRWWLSLSHTDECAMASVIAVG